MKHWLAPIALSENKCSRDGCPLTAPGTHVQCSFFNIGTARNVNDIGLDPGNIIFSEGEQDHALIPEIKDSSIQDVSVDLYDGQRRQDSKNHCPRHVTCKFHGANVQG